ncbi:hypothetical protein BHE74_00041166 [Ensete ventricosum]|nr:hypothetical protein BHE74_00041166 [Ensete ventricosum]
MAAWPRKHVSCFDVWVGIMDGHFSSAIVPPATTLEATKVAAWAVSARRFQWRNRSGDVIDDVSIPTW